MAGNTRFHSKHHAEQHHATRTSKNAGYPDAATDPIASPDAPYQGYFHVNGLLNVANDLPTDTQYPTFKDQLPSIDYNYLRDKLVVDDDVTISGDTEIKGNLRVRENIYVDKNVYLSGGDAGVLNFGDAANDKVKFNAYINSDFIPTLNHTYNIGTLTRRWDTFYGKSINIDGDFLLGANGECLLKADVQQDHVLIGTCTTASASTKLHVKGGHSEFETSLRVSGYSQFDSDVTINADVLMRNDDSIIWGDSADDNYITSTDTQLKISSGTEILNVSPTLSLHTPVIDMSNQIVHLNFDELTVGPANTSCVFHLQSANRRVGIGTCNPVSTVHIDGGTTITGINLNVTATTMSVNNTTTNVAADNITTTSTQTNTMHGKNVVIRGTDTTGDRAVHVEGSVLRVDAATRADLQIPEINLGAQRTHVSLIKADDAFKIDGDTFVIDSDNDRVAINRLLPQATLHVGGDTIFDDDVQIDSGDFTVGTGTENTRIHSNTSTVVESPAVLMTGTDEIELNGPLIDINSGMIDTSSQSTTIRVSNAAPASVKFVSASNVAALPGSTLGNLAALSTSTLGTTILSIDGQNNRIGVMTDNPDKTFTLQGDMSVTGALTEIVSTAVDVDSENTSIQATTQLDVDTPTLRFVDDTAVTLKTNVNSLDVDNGTLSVDSFNNRVGFGTTTPEDTVHVQGDMKVDGTHVDIDTTGDTVVDSNKIKLTSTDWTTLMNGYVGIDIDIPNARLNIQEPTQTADLSQLATGVSRSGLLMTHEFVNDTFTPGMFWSTSNDNVLNPKAAVFTHQIGSDGTSIYLGTSNNYSIGLTSFVKVDPSGRVGIGTTDVTHDLTVSGDMIVDQLEVTDLVVDNLQVNSLQPNRIVYKDATTEQLETHDSLYCNSDTGQIGINTTTPAADSSLHVHDGDVRITNNFKTLVLDSNHDLSHALVDTNTTTGSMIQGSVGEHLVLDLLNDNFGDSIAFRHSSNNTGVVDTVGFLYRPGANGQAGVGIGVNQNELGSYTLAVGGTTNIKGDLRVEGNFFIQGASAQLEIQNLEITDKNVVVNKGGTTQNSINAGLIILGGVTPGDDDEVGYVKVDENDNSLLVAKAPTGSILTLDINNNVTFKLESSLNVTGTSTINQNVTTTGDVLHNSLQLTSRMINNIDIELVRSELDQVIIDRVLTQAELDVTQTGAGLNTDGTYTPNAAASYISQTTSLHNTDQTLDVALKNEETARINKDDALQAELDNTQAAAGLDAAGSYVVNGASSYLNNAVTLNDADVKLDAKLREIDNIVGHGSTPNSGSTAAQTNHLTRLNTLDSHVVRLDGRIDSTNTDVAAVSASLDSRVDKQVAVNRIVATDSNRKMTNTDLINWISGTNQQIDVTDDGAGGIKLSLPQGNFVDDSSVTVGNLTLTDGNNITNSRITFVDNNGTIKTVNNLQHWIAGTTNQINVADDSDGSITLSLPQDIHTTAIPTFNNIKLTGVPGSGLPATEDRDEILVLKSDGTLHSRDLSEKVFGGNAIDVWKRGTGLHNTSYNSSIRIDHANTSSQPSVINSTTPTNTSNTDAAVGNRQVIQDIEVDTYGHITSIKSKDVSYGLATKDSPGLVPTQVTHTNSENMFLNADNTWVTFPNVVDKVESIHPDLYVNPNTADDTIDLDISNTLTIGSTDTAQTSSANRFGSGQVEIVGGLDTNYDALHLRRSRPRIWLQDQQSSSSANQYIQNWGGNLRIGSSTSGSNTATIDVAAGTTGTTTIRSNAVNIPNGLVTGRTSGYAFKGDLDGIANRAEKWSSLKTITLQGDVTGSVSSDFSGTTTMNVTVNKVQNDAVTLGTNTTGKYLTGVTAGSNISVTAGPTNDGGTQSVGVIASPTFTKVTAGTFDTTSDLSLKQNINLITDDPLEKINKLQGVSFNWKSDASTKKYGLIANEVEQIIPEAVTTNDDGIRSIDYNAVVAHLIEAVKTLTDKVNQLSS